jgi:hypothetical protein
MLYIIALAICAVPIFLVAAHLSGLEKLEYRGYVARYLYVSTRYGGGWFLLLECPVLRDFRHSNDPYSEARCFASENIQRLFTDDGVAAIIGQEEKESLTMQLITKIWVWCFSFSWTSWNTIVTRPLALGGNPGLLLIRKLRMPESEYDSASIHKDLDRLILLKDSLS